MQWRPADHIGAVFARGANLRDRVPCPIRWNGHARGFPDQASWGVEARLPIGGCDDTVRHFILARKELLHRRRFVNISCASVQFADRTPCHAGVPERGPRGSRTVVLMARSTIYGGRRRTS